MLISVVSLYIFILIGYMLKKQFKGQVNEKSFVLISVYYLQPFLVFWGLTRKKIDMELLLTPLLYLSIIFVALVFFSLISYVFKAKKEKSVFIASSLIGNTGNLAIPLGIILFGEDSVAYISIINIANLFFIYLVGVFFYARGSYTFKEALYSIVKIPLIWVAIFAIWFNYMGFSVAKEVEKTLSMGAYSAIVIQLVIFGLYLATIKVRELNLKLNLFTLLAKLLVLPVLGFFILSFLDVSTFVFSVIILSLATPLAVTNINLAALYDCKAKEVTGILFSTSVVFFVLSFLYVGVFR